MTVAKIIGYLTYRGQHFSQSINIFMRSHLDYADAFYGQAYPQKNRIITTQYCMSFNRWQLEKSQGKRCAKC